MLMISPLVTISIPVYNAEKHLKEAVQSVLNQTYENFELILINDGSNDHSLDIMTSFHDDRIILIDDGLNKGLIERLNQSINLARGKYYARMDADDIMSIHRIDRQVTFMDSHPNIDLVGSSIMRIDDDNNIVGSGFFDGRVTKLAHPTVLGKTDWFRANPYLSWATRAEDTELWLRTSFYSNFWAIKEPLLFYRDFGISNTQKYISTQKTMLRIFAKHKTYRMSLAWFLCNYFITIVKICAYYVADKFGRTDFLVAKRGWNTVPQELYLTSSDILNAIEVK